MNLKSRLEDLRTGGNPVRKGIPKIVEIRMGFPNGISDPNGISEWDFRMDPNPRKSREAQLRAGSRT